MLAQAMNLLHLLLRLPLLLRQLRRLLPQLPHTKLELERLLPQQLLLLHRQAYHLRLLQAVLLLTVLVDQIILAPMECAAASGALWYYRSTYCGECCQSNCSGQPPSPPSPSPPPPSPPTTNSPPSSGFNYNADHGEDSRLIACVGNWQGCPTDEQIDAYSHIVIAFAVSYTWSPGKNNCDSECQVSSSLPLCGNQARPDLIDKWRGMGKKVIMSFGGAGMGGS